MIDHATQSWKPNLSGWMTKRFLLGFTDRCFCALVGSQFIVGEQPFNDTAIC
jgi:hypothetical protein